MTTVLLTLEYLFRISLYLGYTTPRGGYDTQADFWAASTVGVLPLFVAFALAFLLLLAWQLILFWAEGSRLSRAGKVIGAANAVLIVGLGLSMWGSLEPMWAERYYASGAGDWNVTREVWWGMKWQLRTGGADPFIGRWRVESVNHLGDTRPDFHFQWVEVRSEYRWVGWETALGVPRFDGWEPPGRLWDGWSPPGPLGDGKPYAGYWAMGRQMMLPSIDGDRLVLSSDEQFPGPRFRVTLVRVGDLTPPAPWWDAIDPWPASEQHRFPVESLPRGRVTQMEPWWADSTTNGQRPR